MRITPEEMLRLSARFAESGDDLRYAASRAQTELAGFGAPWGSDDQGKEFAKRYLPAAENAMRAIHLIADAFSGIAATLNRNATDTQEQEDATRTQFTTPPAS